DAGLVGPGLNDSDDIPFLSRAVIELKPARRPLRIRRRLQIAVYQVLDLSDQRRCWIGGRARKVVSEDVRRRVAGVNRGRNSALKGLAGVLVEVGWPPAFNRGGYQQVVPERGIKRLVV